MGSSKHSWSGILIQYSEQTKMMEPNLKYHNPSLIKVEHSKALKRIGALSLKRLMKFSCLFKNDILPKEVHVMVIQSDHTSLQKLMYTVTKMTK